MNEIKNFLKVLDIFLITILLSSCNGEFYFNKKNDLLINPNKSNKEKLEITISCDEGNIGEYLKDGWKIKNKKSKEKVCSWKSIPANDTCDINKDKGCKIIKPDSFGIETIYLLEK
tara:strand:- start:1119 stop:1466 length:348 start_codon:yes stop_codon:yes gene_type:complete